MNNLKNTLALLALIGSSFAMAHTSLESSMPGDGAMLGQSPEAITLEFGEAVNLTSFEVLSKMTGTTVEVSFRASPQAAEKFELPVPALAMGAYQVNWAALGDDGHKVSGSFGFMVNSSDMAMKEGAMMNHDGAAMPMQHGAMMNHDGTAMPMQHGAMMHDQDEDADAEEGHNH